MLLLLPSSPRKLEAAWQGPFVVIRQVDLVNYEVDLGPHRRKRHPVFHINLLRLFRQPQLVAFTTATSAEDEDNTTDEALEDSCPLLSDKGEPTVNPLLEEAQPAELMNLLGEFSSTLTAQPGRTNAVQHDIQTGSAQPIRSRPYRLAQTHFRAILKFAHYLLGRQFALVTDHRPLSWIAQHSSANARVARWAIALQPFAFQVQYRPGRCNGNTDALSRR